MQIDWFTAIAQLINFLILVYILKRLLYDRIVKAMDKREEKIASRLNEADSKNKEAENKRQEYEQKIKKIEDKKNEILENARREADEKRKEMLKEARNEIDEQRQNWQESIKREKSEFYENLRKELGDHIFSLSRQVLESMAGEDIQSKMIDKFIDNIDELKSGDDEKISKAIKDSDEPIAIETSFEMKSEDKKRIEKALKELGGSNQNYEYKESSGLICGIELKTNGNKIAWSIDSYMENLESKFKSRLKTKTGKSEKNNQDDQKEKSEKSEEKSESKKE